MRAAFIQKLVELAERDPRIILLTGDLGYLALEPFADRFPDRFFNVGVAEQNLVGIATGMAEAGFIPFVYSIVPFAVLRPLEFIRNGPVLHQLPVRIVGIGGGFEYGPNGFTHYGLEDVACLRALPGISIFAPADAMQTTAVLERTWNFPGPVYYRLGKDDRTFVPGLNGNFDPDRLQVVKSGGRVLILAMGGIATEAAVAAERLEASGHAATFAILAAVQPPPVRDLLQLLKQHPAVVTVEAHAASGGLGSLVGEIIAEEAIPCRLIRCAVARGPDGRVGSQNWLHQQYGLHPDQITAAALTVLGSPGIA